MFPYLLKPPNIHMPAGFYFLFRKDLLNLFNFIIHPLLFQSRSVRFFRNKQQFLFMYLKWQAIRIVEKGHPISCKCIKSDRFTRNIHCL